MNGKEFVKAWFGHIDNQRFDELKSLMAPNHQFHNPMTPGPIGVDEHLGMMQMMTSAFDGAHHLDLIVEENGWVAVSGSWSGKHSGEFNGVAATGNDVQFTWADFFKIENGHVTEERFEMNPMSIMAQIGAVGG